MKTHLLLCIIIIATSLVCGIQAAAPSKLFLFLTGQSQAVMFHYGEDYKEIDKFPNSKEGLVTVADWIKELNPSMEVNYKMNASGSTAISQHHLPTAFAFVNDTTEENIPLVAMIKARDSMTAAAKTYGSDHLFVVIHFCHSSDADAPNSRWNATKYIGSLTYFMNTLRDAALAANPSLADRYIHGFQLHGTRYPTQNTVAMDNIRKIMLTVAGRGNFPGVSTIPWARLLNSGMMALSEDRYNLIGGDSVHFPRSTNLRLARELAIHISREIGGESPATRFVEVDSIGRVNDTSLRVRVLHTPGKRLVVPNVNFHVYTAANTGGSRQFISGFSVISYTNVGMTLIDLTFNATLPSGKLYVSYGVMNDVGMYTPEKQSIYEDLSKEQDVLVHFDGRDVNRNGTKLVVSSILHLYDLEVSDVVPTAGESTTVASGSTSETNSDTDNGSDSQTSNVTTDVTSTVEDDGEQSNAASIVATFSTFLAFVIFVEYL